MATLQFKVSIDAPKEKVWERLWNDKYYRQWTSAFMEGSYAESDWKEGSKILFLTPSGEGMFSIIEKKTDNEQMTFRHLGEIRNGVEQKKDWKEATEAYTLTEHNGVTEVTANLSMDDNPQFEAYFNNTFPKALEILKNISEQ